MLALIQRTRLLINDVAGVNQIFADQDIQDVLDACRMDYQNAPLKPVPTFAVGTLQYLDFYAEVGDWEDSPVLKQYLTVIVTPSVSEPIVGHWQFAVSTFPPIAITGRSYDVYRSAADLLERWAAKWTLSYDFSSDSQSFKRSQAAMGLCNLAKAYRRQQRPSSISLIRTDLGGVAGDKPSLAPTALDYMAKG